MANRRILSLWFPRLAAERVLRQRRDALPMPFAITEDRNRAQVLVSLNPSAEAAGLRQGQLLRDATAICPVLLTRPANPQAEAAFLTALRRWAGKFSPWVAEEPPESLVIDLTGCARLFGGEAGLLEQIAADCADLGLTLRAGVADTRGAAWALARYAGQLDDTPHAEDAILQGTHRNRTRLQNLQSVIAPSGRTAEALGPLPLAALRLEPAVIEGLTSLGLHNVADLLALPRAPLARRFGTAALRRLDQALGVEAEPVSAAKAPTHFFTRLTFPDPIGLRTDIEAGIDRLLPPLCARLRHCGHGARRVRLQAFRSDGKVEVIEVGLARAADTPERIRPLLWLKLDSIDPGFGIDCLRLGAVESEPIRAAQQAAHLHKANHTGTGRDADTALDDLIGRLGARLGDENVIRLHPAETHIPAKASQILAVAWSEPWPEAWPPPRSPRPLRLFPPEPLSTCKTTGPPATIAWRRRNLAICAKIGPERILPEWWLDDPEWRTGPRDYWRCDTTEGDQLWLFQAHGAEMAGGWFCEGAFT